MDDRERRGLSEAKSNVGSPSNPHEANLSNSPREGMEAAFDLFYKQGLVGLGKEVLENRKGSLFPHNHLKEIVPLLSRVQPSRSDRPAIKQVLRKLDLAGRMVAWSIQLFEFAISYKNRGHIKAQTLVNFVIEMTVMG
ncbi:hypothetical protein CR513_22933, partial [Mucuna pruriens]